MSSKKTTPPLRGTPPKEWNNSPSPKGWQAKPDGVVPKLRFPEFRGAEGWKQTALGSVARLKNGYAFKSADYVDSGPFQIITIANVQQGSLALDSTKRIAQPPSDIQSHQKLDIGDILISMTGNVGRVCRVTCNSLLLNQRVGKLIPEEIVPEFFYHSLQRDEFRNAMQLKAAGGAQGNLSSGDITDYTLHRPADEAEQQTIAECLSSVDEVIAAQARKVDALKTHKKWLMQQLFPREGETQPRLRFPEFQNAGAWEEKRLSSEVHLISGMHLSPDQYSTTGEVPYFTGPSDFTNDIESVTKWTKRSANMAAPEDTLITVKGSGVGEVWYSTLQAVALGRQLMAVRLKQGSSQFIFQFLLTKKTRFEDLGSGNLIPGLSRTDILDMEAHFPSSTEQQRIATCLSSLDALITAEMQKLEALKTHKKGLMQQLFPSPRDIA